MKRIIYNKGDHVGSLIYLEEKEQKKGERFALFLCKCGNTFETLIHSVRRGNTKSCGCIQREMVGNLKLSHGDCKGGKIYYLYSTWYGIKNRCFNRKAHNYTRYGGRGITLYKKWKDSYLLFKDYILTNLGERPDGYTLDRIDNNGNYEPNNIRWASNSEQRTNQRING